MPPIPAIFSTALHQTCRAFHEIIGLGIVNRVFEVEGADGRYIMRLHQDADKLGEYQKERWCLEQVGQLGIPVPELCALGEAEGWVFMIQRKAPGRNGSLCPPDEQPKIWRRLGAYAALFQHIDQVDDPALKRQLLHRDWKSRVRYNLGELTPRDSLRQTGVFTAPEQQAVITVLERLLSCDFKMGLVHGDLCPRNVLVDGETIYLLDWGTAEINVIPINEIGLLLMEGDVGPEELGWYLEGYGMSAPQFSQIKTEIEWLNLLDRLDKYRWAEEHAPAVLDRYVQNLRQAFQAIS